MGLASGLEELDLTRKRILITILALVTADVTASFFLYGTGSGQGVIDTRTAVTDVEVMISTGSAAMLGLLIAIKQGFGGLHGKTYTALAIGLMLWTAGEAMWVCYEVFLQNELPDVSIADALWISGYGFFGYHLFKNYRYFGQTVDRRLAITMGALLAIVITYVTSLTFSITQINSSEELATAIVRISYGIGDFVMIYPALLLVVTLRKAKLHFSPWFFISIGLLVTASADITFALVSILDVIDEEWISNLLYDAANMTIAGGLYWYYKHIVSFGTKANMSQTSTRHTTAASEN